MDNYRLVESFPRRRAIVNCQLSIVNCQLKSSFPFVQDDQRGNHAGNPSAERQEEHDEHGAAALVEHRKGRENDGEKYSE